MASVVWIPERVFQDKSNMDKLAAAEIDMVFVGNLINWLWDRSKLSILASENILSGNVLSLLWERSMILSFFNGLNASAGMSMILFQERKSTWIFFVFLKQSKSISISSLWLRSSHCKCGIFPKTPWVTFVSWLWAR